MSTARNARGGDPMTSVTKTSAKDYWPAYSSLEGQLRDVARMATIARFYAHEIEWPKELTEYQSEEICRLFLLVGQVKDMAEALVKTYDAGFQSGAQSGEAADPILPLVQAARNAWDRLGEAIDEATKVEEERPDEAEAVLAPAHRILDSAMDNLLKTPPTTLAGAREAIAWFAEYDEPNVPKTSGEYLRTLIRSPLFAA
jgi:hypothetical protein